MCPGLRLCPHPSAGMWALTSVRSWLQRQGFYTGPGEGVALPESQRQHRAARRGLQGVKGHSALGMVLLLPGVGTWKSAENREGPAGRSGERDW